VGLRRGLACLAFGLVCTAAVGAAAEFQVPPLRGAVNDDARMLSASARARIESALRALKDQAGTQLAVLTVESLGGETIEQASIRVTDQWQLGDEKRDDGVLMMIARDEQRIRIEVGQGLEGVLTDAWSRRIIDESMRPLFRAGDIDGGVTVGVFEIAQRTNPEVDLRTQLAGATRPGPPRRARGSGGIGGLFPLLFFVLLLLMRSGSFGGHRRHGRYLWGPTVIGSGIGMGMGRGASFGAGGFGGGGFGGFSGGGGGFSGGGAAGGW